MSSVQIALTQNDLAWRVRSIDQISVNDAPPGYKAPFIKAPALIVSHNCDKSNEINLIDEQKSNQIDAQLNDLNVASPVALDV